MADELDINRNLKLGELLVAAGLVTRQDVDDHLTLAKFMGLPLGNLLVREKKLSRELLKVAIRLQTLIGDGMISLQLACRAMRDIRHGRCQAEQMLESLDSYSENVRTGRLGELLVDAGLLSEVTLGRALVTSMESSKPLGQTLIMQGAISEELVGAALTVQGNVRSRVLDYKSAVAHLRDSHFMASTAAFMPAC